MDKKKIIIISVIVIALGVGAYFYKKNMDKTAAQKADEAAKKAAEAAEIARKAKMKAQEVKMLADAAAKEAPAIKKYNEHIVAGTSITHAAAEAIAFKITSLEEGISSNSDVTVVATAKATISSLKAKLKAGGYRYSLSDEGLTEALLA